MNKLNTQNDESAVLSLITLHVLMAGVVFGKTVFILIK